MEMRLAVATIATLYEPLSHSKMSGFLERIPGIYDAVDVSPGLIDRSTIEDSWGPITLPRCYPDLPLDQQPSTFTIWADIESLVAFAYYGAHGEAMPHRKEWVRPGSNPSYVLWWIKPGHKPNWREACDRFDHLHEHGPTPFSFNLKSPFDSEGNRYKIQVPRVQALRNR